MNNKEIKPAWMGHGDSKKERQRKEPTTRTELIPSNMWQIAGDIIIATIIIGTATHLYRMYQAKIALEIINETLEKTFERMPQAPIIQAAPRIETPEERELRRRSGKKALQNQSHCEFWQIQTPSERRTEKLKEYCR